MPCCFRIALPLLPFCPFVFFLRFRKQGTVGNPCSRTTSSIFALLLACRAPGTPVHCKAGLQTRLPARACQQRPGPTTPDPEPLANHFSPFSRWFAIRQNLGYNSTPAQITRTHPITRRTTSAPASFLFELFVYRVRRHTGNHAIASRLSPSPHASDLSGFLFLCPRTLTSV